MGFPGCSAGKEPACNEGDLGSIPGLGRSPGEGKGYSLQYSGLQNSMDYIVHGVAKSWTRLGDFRFQYKKRSLSTEPEGKKLCEDRGRERSDAATAKGCLKPPEAARSEGFFPRASTGPWLSQHLHFGLPASRTTREHISVV